MKWEHHYTGIDIWNPSNDGSGWYAHRDSDTKRVKFIRWSRKYVGNVCLFLGYMNYLKMQEYNWGAELDVTVWHGPSIRLGLALPTGWNPLYWRLNPNCAVPSRRWWRYQWSIDNGSVAMRAGWLCLGFDLPHWVQKRLWSRLMQEQERAAAEYDAQCARWEDERKASDPLYGERMDSADMGEC